MHEIPRSSLVALNPFRNFTTLHRPNQAGYTFPARCIRCEGHEVPRQLDPVGCIVTDNQDTMSENGEGGRIRATRPVRTCPELSSSDLVESHMGSQLVVVERCKARASDSWVMALHVADQSSDLLETCC